MRLYVHCRYCGNKIYINSPAKIRAELPYQFTLRCQQPNCPAHDRYKIYGKSTARKGALSLINSPVHDRYKIYGRGEIYGRHEVIAEPGIQGLVGGALITGVLGGLVAGPIGALIGMALGGGAGSASDQADREAAERFNAS